MAVHRRRSLELVPTRLLNFNIDEWAEPGDDAWWQPFGRWNEARRVWAGQHPDSVLGSMLDLMKAERKVWGRFASNSART